MSAALVLPWWDGWVSARHVWVWGGEATSITPGAVVFTLLPLLSALSVCGGNGNTVFTLSPFIVAVLEGVQTVVFTSTSGPGEISSSSPGGYLGFENQLP